MTKLIDGFDDIGIFFDLENLRLHCGFTRDILAKEQSKFKKQFDKNIENLSGEEKERYQEWQADNHFYLFDVFPSLQWLSLFNTAYSVFEKTMNYICRLAESKTDSKIKLNDFHGKGIERAKLYLNKVADINKPFNSKPWQNITKYAELRNVIAHSTGELDLNINNHKKVFDYATSHPNIKVIRHYENSDYLEIQLEPELVLESIQEYTKFFRMISEHDLPN